MFIIGSTGRNSGKTELACTLIDKFRTSRQVVAAKVTLVKEGDDKCPRSCEGCGVCINGNTHYRLSREVDSGRGKDTERMVTAGASSVFWLRVHREHLEEGAAALLEAVGKNAFVVCESNSLRSVVNPGVFVICRHRGEERFKKSTEAVRVHMDRLVTCTGSDTAHSFDLDLDDVDILPSGWALRSHAAAIILAGGMSQRMQSDKSMLPVEGTPMVEYIHRQLGPNFKQTLISANDVEKYGFLGLKVVPDGVAGHGPLMGIASALAASDHDVNFVTACDMPDVNMVFVRRMLREVKGFDAVVPIDQGRMEPLFAIYRKSMVSAFNGVLEQGRRRIRDAFDGGRVNYLDITESESLKNLNTREEYDGFISQLDEEPGD